MRLYPYIIAAVALLLMAALAPHLAPVDPYAQNLALALAPPDATHPLGTDRYGRDMLARVIVGSQTTLLGALAVLVTITVVGTALGMVAGYVGGRIDSVIMRLTDFFLAFPELVFAIAVAGVMGGGLVPAAVALAAVGWPRYARLARSLTQAASAEPYVDLARMGGARTGVILRRHILPNIAGPIVVTAALNMGTIIMELAGLSFLGLGAQPPTAEWGAMMAGGRSLLQTAPWVVLAPGMAIFIAVAVFNLLADRLRDVLDAENFY